MCNYARMYIFGYEWANNVQGWKSFKGIKMLISKEFRKGKVLNCSSSSILCKSQALSLIKYQNFNLICL